MLAKEKCATENGTFLIKLFPKIQLFLILTVCLALNSFNSVLFGLCTLTPRYCLFSLQTIYSRLLDGVCALVFFFCFCFRSFFSIMNLLFAFQLHIFSSQRSQTRSSPLCTKTPIWVHHSVCLVLFFRALDSLLFVRGFFLFWAPIFIMCIVYGFFW